MDLLKEDIYTNSSSIATSLAVSKCPLVVHHSGFWGDINFFHEHRHDIPPMKIYNVGVCLVQFLKFFMEPFWRNCNFKILTLNPGFSALKCKNPLKSTIFIHFGHAIWQIRTIFHQKKDSGLILTALSEKNGEKCISS